MSAAAPQWSKEKLAHSSTPSRLFIYWNERAIEHTTSVDSGAMLRDGIKSVHKDGACHGRLSAPQLT